MFLNDGIVVNIWEDFNFLSGKTFFELYIIIDYLRYITGSFILVGIFLCQKRLL